ncbi:hypothetical protein FI667_g5218, partial [Globisporangium splendens]
MDVWMLPLCALLVLVGHALWRVTRIWRAAAASQRNRVSTSRWTRKRDRNGDATVLLAHSFHAPLYDLSIAVLGLRAALYAYVAVEQADQPATVSSPTAFFWLLEMANVGVVALYGYLIVFYVCIVHWHRWPTTGLSCSGSWMNGVYTAFCVLLVVLATLFACLRSSLVQLEASNRVSAGAALVIDQVTSVYSIYSSLMWTLLGLLLLKYQAKCMHFLWRERRCHRLHVLDGTSLHAMSVCNALLAAIVLIRAASVFMNEPTDFSAMQRLVATQCQSTGESSSSSSILKQLFCQYVAWELAILGTLFHMLNKVPIVSKYPPLVDSELNAVAATQTPSSVSYHFHVPKLREIVHDYVTTTSETLQQRAQLDRYEQLFYDEQRNATTDETGDAHILYGGRDQL